MNQNLLNRYLYHQRKSFDRCFPKIQDVSDDEAIHDIRVSIKKIRTLLLLIDFIYPGEWNIKAKYKPYRNIFKHLGSIRDLQVQQKLGSYLMQKTGKDLTAYLLFLSHRETNTRKSVHGWLLRNPSPDWHALEENVHTYYFKTGKNQIFDSANNYILGKIRQSKSLTSQKDRTTIHLIRRLLKEARYMMDMMGAVLNNKPHYKHIQNKIKPIENYLGEWHDRMVALDFIFQFEKEVHLYSPNRRVNMQPIVKRLMAESHNLVKKATREINKLPDNGIT